MIAITGATGKLGKLVITHLVKKIPANQIIAIVRNVSKAKELVDLGVILKEADYNSETGWSEALKNVDKLLLISSNEIGKRESQHRLVIEAAKKSNISHILYTSILKAETSKLLLAKEHLATEKHIRNSLINFTILRNGWYLENHTENLSTALQFGVIHGAANKGFFSSATREDYALAAAAALTNEKHLNKVYELAGDESFNLEELAEEVSILTNKKINYLNHSFDEYNKLLIEFGLPAEFALMLADSDVGASNGELQSQSKDLSQIIGKPTTSLKENLKRILV